MDCKQPFKKGKANRDSNKWKTVYFNDLDPKENHQDVKHCMLCKKHSVTHVNHKMSDCYKYEKDSTHKNGFEKGQHNSTAPDKNVICLCTAFYEDSEA